VLYFSANMAAMGCASHHLFSPMHKSQTTAAPMGSSPTHWTHPFAVGFLHFPPLCAVDRPPHRLLYPMHRSSRESESWSSSWTHQTRSPLHSAIAAEPRCHHDPLLSEIHVGVPFIRFFCCGSFLICLSPCKTSRSLGSSSPAAVAIVLRCQRR
jgi:hypothetical protein